MELFAHALVKNVKKNYVRETRRVLNAQQIWTYILFQLIKKNKVTGISLVSVSF